MSAPKAKKGGTAKRTSFVPQKEVFLFAAMAIQFALYNLSALKAHEQVSVRHLLELKEEVLQDQVLKRPLVVDVQTGVILDGHHRFRLLLSLGFLLAPVYLVNYLEDQEVQVFSNRSEFHITKPVVIARGLSGFLFPVKTTRHVFARPINERPVPLEILKGEKNEQLFSYSRELV